jgi:hypothetical protein
VTSRPITAVAQDRVLTPHGGIGLLWYAVNGYGEGAALR